MNALKSLNIKLPKLKDFYSFKGGIWDIVREIVIYGNT